MELLHVFLALAFVFYLASSDSQVQTLIIVKSSFNTSYLDSWYANNVHTCNWMGVKCDEDFNVIALSLASMGISGKLSPSLGLLKSLIDLDLQYNNITGEIPKELGNLTNLETFNMDNNQLTGEIPASFKNLEKLQILSLNQNNLKGRFPAFLSNLANLTNLQLANNQFTGIIPSRLFQLSNYNFTGNQLNCGPKFSHTCEPSASKKGEGLSLKIKILLTIIGGAIGFILLGVVVLLAQKALRKGLHQPWKGLHHPRAFVDLQAFHSPPR